MMAAGCSFNRQTSRTISQSSDPVPLEQDNSVAQATASTPTVSALTKEQLRQAMIHLLNVSVVIQSMNIVVATLYMVSIGFDLFVK